MYIYVFMYICTVQYVRTYNFVALCWNVCVYLGWTIFQCITHIAIARCAIINIADILHVSNIAYAIIYHIISQCTAVQYCRIECIK